jgi:hypothetical protein
MNCRFVAIKRGDRLKHRDATVGSAIGLYDGPKFATPVGQELALTSENSWLLLGERKREIWRRYDDAWQRYDCLHLID